MCFFEKTIPSLKALVLMLYIFSVPIRISLVYITSLLVNLNRSVGIVNFFSNVCARAH